MWPFFIGEWGLMEIGRRRLCAPHLCHEAWDLENVGAMADKHFMSLCPILHIKNFNNNGPMGRKKFVYTSRNLYNVVAMAKKDIWQIKNLNYVESHAWPNRTSCTPFAPSQRGAMFKKYFMFSIYHQLEKTWGLWLSGQNFVYTICPIKTLNNFGAMGEKTLNYCATLSVNVWPMYIYW